MKNNLQFRRTWTELRVPQNVRLQKCDSKLSARERTITWVGVNFFFDPLDA